MLLQKDLKKSYLFSLIVTLYNYVDKILSTLAKISFPFWAIPYLSILLLSRIIDIVKSICSAISKNINVQKPNILEYAILKGNGRYLRQESDYVFVYQFYDYMSRRFLQYGQHEVGTKIVEIQCDNLIGIDFLSKNRYVSEIKGLQNNNQIVKQFNKKLSLVQLSSYQISGPSLRIDCFLLFNFKQKFNKYKTINQSFDLLKILKFCHFHLDHNGYLVFGDYFNEGEKEVNNYIMLFDALNFKISQRQDITKNIQYSAKIKQKNNSKAQNNCNLIFNKIKKLIKGNKIEQNKRFQVFILEKGKCFPY